MLALIKRRTLALLRKGVEPSSRWRCPFPRRVAGRRQGGRGVDAVLGAIEQLSGYPMPASAVESMILPARVADYTPSMLDELTAAGEIYWVGDGQSVIPTAGCAGTSLIRNRSCRMASQRSIAARSFLPPLAAAARTSLTLLPPGLPVTDRSQYVDALWELVWAW